MLTQIKTREELDTLIEEFAQVSEIAPTLARAQLDLIKKKIIRRGGPGRESKLDRKESTIVCKEILKRVGMKITVKKALEEVSKICLIY